MPKEDEGQRPKQEGQEQKRNYDTPANHAKWSRTPMSVDETMEAIRKGDIKPLPPEQKRGEP